jgi:hypothetical protein
MGMMILSLPAAPTDPVTGTIWADTATNRAHVFDGSKWIQVLGGVAKLPETWQEWFDYYVECAVKFKPDSVKRGYVHEEMRARFPGNYSIDLSGDKWNIVFATPADETWFRLKYV